MTEKERGREKVARQTGTYACKARGKVKVGVRVRVKVRVGVRVRF
jgi:hypothetical protein